MDVPFHQYKVYQKSVSLSDLIYECAMEFSYVRQWLDISTIESAGKHYNQAEKLLEICEVLVCGSVGGFDKGQFSNERGRDDGGKYYYEFDRLLWLWNHYTDFNKNSKYKKFIDDLSNYYKRRK